VTDTFLARRVGGPGIASSYYFRLPIHAAKTAVAYMVDAIRLEVHTKFRQAELDLPFDEYSSFFSSVCLPFGVKTAMIQSSRPSSLARQWQEQIVRNSTELRTFHLEETMDKADIDVWQSIATRLRTAHPDYKRFEMLLMSSVLNKGEMLRFPELDQFASDSVDKLVHAQSNDLNRWSSSGSITLASIIYKPAQTLTKWNLQANLRSKYC
jgi:hypothetical protein